MGPIDPMLSRRAVLRGGAQAVGLLGVSLLGGSVVVPTASAASADAFGPLRSPDANGLRLPPGFSSRIVARSGDLVAGTSYRWHKAPDGGATFATAEGGWIYVSNAELYRNGGVGAIRFAPDGTIADAYSILTGTHRNCAGGPTPWGAWLSCEEIDEGRVYECNPQEPSQGVLVPSLGTFRHEAAAVDPVHGTVYLTEDQRDGRLYRFRASGYPSLASGTLEVAEVLDPEARGSIRPGQVRRLRWHPLAEPNPAGGGASSRRQPVAKRATRHQVPASTAFDGGEGCSYQAGLVFFSTKGDGRVWKLDTAADTLSIYYDQATNPNALATNVDNVYAAPNGDVYVAEDPGNLEIVALTPSGGVKPIVQVTGAWGSEVTGPALSPDGTRLYFSSQRNPGITYEVSGPFASRA